VIRTQIQLPETLYRGLKRLAAAKEWTLAETLRRASEHWLEIHSPDRMPVSTWEPPAPLSLGGFRSGPETWRELANPSAMAVDQDRQ
jgi:hypothetical protein